MKDVRVNPQGELKITLKLKNLRTAVYYKDIWKETPKERTKKLTVSTSGDQEIGRGRQRTEAVLFSVMSCKELFTFSNYVSTEPVIKLKT